MTSAGEYIVLVADEEICLSSASDPVSITQETPNDVITDILYTQLTEEGSSTLCIGSNVLELEGDEIVYIDVCQEPVSFGVEYEVNGLEVCIHFERLDSLEGLDSLCLVVCDNSACGGCDTTVVVVEITEVIDTLMIDEPCDEPPCHCFIPNVLTPNNDQLNDVFEVECLTDIEGARLIIFNRWGNPGL